MTPPGLPHRYVRIPEHALQLSPPLLTGTRHSKNALTNCPGERLDVDTPVNTERTKVRCSPRKALGEVGVVTSTVRTSSVSGRVSGRRRPLLGRTV